MVFNIAPAPVGVRCKLRTTNILEFQNIEDKMNFNANYSMDRRRRFYRPVVKILKYSGVEKPELLIGNKEYQTVIHHIPERTELHPGGKMMLDFGSSFHGGIRINTIGFGTAVRVKFGESVSEAAGNSNQECSRKDAVLDLPTSGMLEYGNTVFRFVEITNVGDRDISLLNIIGVALECDIDVTGSFESSDCRLNDIWKTAVRTVHLCMQDYIYDGAKRDRIVWMGDMHPEVKGILCAFSDHSIIRDSFEFLIAQAPATRPMNNIYTYSCWFIISVWDYYLASGDRAFLQRHADYFETMLKTFAAFIDENGSECIPERRFLDWPNNDNLDAKHAGIQALLFWMMQTGEAILNELGRNADFARLAQNKLKKHIPSPAGRKAPAALLQLTGFADAEKVLEDDPFNDVSTFYGYYVIQAKKTIPALDLIRRYWGAMLDFGATTFWEDFDLKWTRNACRIDEYPVPGKDDIHADFGKYCYVGLRHSLSHGWSCGPAPFLSERVLGVRFVAPGKVSISPDLGDLEYARGTIPAPGGLITVEADRSGFKYTLPEGIERVN